MGVVPQVRGIPNPGTPADPHLLFFAHNPQTPATIHKVGIAIDSTRMVRAGFTGSTVRIDTSAGVPGREREFIGAVGPS